MTKSQYTILVADDKQEVVDAVTHDINMLAQKHNKNIKILNALTGLDVISLAENENIDAFYIDYMFEYGMNGDEIIQNIQDPFGTKFYILMSGWKEDVLEKVINKNHHKLQSRCRFLRKPYEMLTFQASFLDMFSFFSMLPYPLPIQYVYEAFQNSPEGIEQTFALKDFYETLLKFSVSILMADILRQENYAEFRVKFKPELNMTYGAWLTWLAQLLEFYNGKTGTAFFPEMIQFYNSSSLNPIEIIGDFKELRDNELGHGYSKDSEWYKIVTSDSDKSVNLLYQNLHFLSRYTLIFPEKTEVLPEESEGYKYQVKSLMGSDMIPGKFDLFTSSRLIPNCVYVYSDTKVPLLLSPFVDYKLCPACKARKFYFLDRIQGAHIIYNSFCNHRVNDKEAKVRFDRNYRFIFNTGTT